MTKTYTARTKGQPYEMTATECETPIGTPGVLITCSCATHGTRPGAAIIATPTGYEFPSNLIHGNVTMALSPMGTLATRQGKSWPVEA